jgi:hypothetical protein
MVRFIINWLTLGGNMYCPKCRKPNPEGQTFCSHCGNKFDSYRTAQKGIERSEKKELGKREFANQTLVIIFLIAFGWGLIWGLGVFFEGLGGLSSALVMAVLGGLVFGTGLQSVEKNLQLKHVAVISIGWTAGLFLMFSGLLRWSLAVGLGGLLGGLTTGFTLRWAKSTFRLEYVMMLGVLSGVGILSAILIVSTFAIESEGFLASLFGLLSGAIITWVTLWLYRRSLNRS